MNILNLYAGIGGNRKLWQDVDVTAVELNPQIANIYSNLYPDDTVVVGDAHDYLKKNYQNFDFIWASPPCQSHSSFRQNICVRYRNTPAKYPDMKLYQEILFLQYNFKGSWVVENVKPYYEPLIPPNAILQRHYFWSNFYIPKIYIPTDLIRKAQIPDLQKHIGIDLSQYKISDKRQILRNCVFPELGRHILAQVIQQPTQVASHEQMSFFSNLQKTL